MVNLKLKEKKLLKKIYYDPNHAGSFSSPEKIYKSLNKKISLGKIKKFLEAEDSYTLPRNIRRKFKRQTVIAPYIDYETLRDGV